MSIGVIAQSGGPTAVINATLVSAIREAKKNKAAITKLYGSRYGPEGIVNEDFLDLYKQKPGTLNLVSRTPGAALGSSRKKVGKDIKEEQILKALKKRDIRYLFYIGGNDSAENAKVISSLAEHAGYELSCFHIPKTIDNDLRECDHTPGFGSAARYVACAFIGDDYESRSLKGIKINIVMGRSAGFLTAASAIARKDEDDAPHLIYVPEIAFKKEKFLSDLEKTMKANKGRAVIAVSEGLEDIFGNPLGWNGKTRDSYGNPQLTGSSSDALGKYLTKIIEKSKLTKRVRVDVLGYAQRSFPLAVSRQDWKEAGEVGAEAVRYAIRGLRKGSIEIIRRQNNPYIYGLKLAPLEAVAKTPRKMPRQFMNKAGTDVTPAFIDYAAPLAGKLPRTGKLENIRA